MTTVAFAVSSSAAIAADLANGPPIAPVRPVTDDYFGTKVEDPYRWMEDSKSDEFAQWMKQQNDYARGVLDHIPGRTQLLERINALSQQGADARRMQLAQGRLFYLKRGAGDIAFKLCVRSCWCRHT